MIKSRENIKNRSEYKYWQYDYMHHVTLISEFQSIILTDTILVL